MKKILSLFVILISLSTFAQEADCERFRTGKFKYEDPNFGVIIVKRDKNTQVEIPAVGNTEIHGSVKWVSECKYILTYQKIVNADVPELIGEKIMIEIIENRGNKYTCRVTSADGFTGTLEVLKIE